MISDADKAAVLTEMINHAEHGARDESISNAAYEWRLKLLTELRSQVAENPDDNDAIKITIGKMEGAYNG